MGIFRSAEATTAQRMSITPLTAEIIYDTDEQAFYGGDGITPGGFPIAGAGVPGPPGPAGADGADGLSAYEVAVAGGFVGTEAEWLASLVGPTGPAGADGATGPAGADGATGPAGADGAPGADGLSAYEVAVAGGFVGTEAEWLASLVGPEGPAGADGTPADLSAYVKKDGTTPFEAPQAGLPAVNGNELITLNQLNQAFECVVSNGELEVVVTSGAGGNSASLLYASLNDVLFASQTTAGTTIYKSLDNGETWTTVPGISGLGITNIIKNNGVYIALGSDISVVYRSIDNFDTHDVVLLPETYLDSRGTHGEGLFVLVAASQTAILSSPDGIAWTSNPWVYTAGAGGYFVNGVLVNYAGNNRFILNRVIRADGQTGVFVFDSSFSTFTFIEADISTGSELYATPETGVVIALSSSNDSAVISFDSGVTFSPISGFAGIPDIELGYPWFGPFYVCWDGFNYYCYLLSFESAPTKFFKSADAITWQEIVLPISGSGYLYAAAGIFMFFPTSSPNIVRGITQSICPFVESINGEKGHVTGYVKNDGTTPFEAPQPGVAPVLPSHLTTKAYVDGEIDTIALTPGPTGADGADGLSAYEVAVAGGFVGTEAEWLASLIGPTGPAGADGAPGPAGADGADGASAYEVAVAGGFVGTEAAWLASLVGPTGPAGADGATGPAGADGLDGESAYEIAVAGGFVGTESQWLASLVGPAGADGATGPAGADGATGPAGADGLDGESAYEIAVAGGFVGTEAAWLASLVGPAGADGATGPAGADGVDGLDATDPANAVRYRLTASGIMASGDIITGLDAGGGPYTWANITLLGINFIGQGSANATDWVTHMYNMKMAGREIFIRLSDIANTDSWVVLKRGPASVGGDTLAPGNGYVTTWELQASSGNFVFNNIYALTYVYNGLDGGDGAVGPAGADGAPGVDGVDGLSAYEIAVAGGFVGTEAEWLASLVGPTGPAGADGAGGLLNVVEDLTPQLGGNLDGTNKTITNISSISAAAALFGSAPANLRAFNIKGSGLNGRLSLQGPAGGQPGLEMTTNDNATRTLIRHSEKGTAGTMLEIFVQNDGGGISMAGRFDEDGSFVLFPENAGTVPANSASFRVLPGAGGLQFRDDGPGTTGFTQVMSELLVAGTTRAYNKGQSTLRSILTIAGGAIIPNLADSNYFTLDLSEAITIQNATGYPANSACAWMIRITVTGAGGWPINFGTNYRFQGTFNPPDVTGDKYTLYMQTFNDGITHVSIFED